MVYDIDWFSSRIQIENDEVKNQILEYIQTKHFQTISHYDRQRVLKIFKNRILGNVNVNYDIIIRCLSIGKDSSSLESHKLRFGDQYGTKKFYEKANACKFNKDRFVEQHGLEKATELLSKRGASCSNYIERYGEELGNIKWNEYKTKRKATYQSRSGSYEKRNLDYFIDKYGIDKGTLIWKNRNDKISYKNSKAYVLTLHNPNIVDQIFYKRKSRGLQYYILKYGATLGEKKHNELKLKRILYRSKDYLIQKHGEEHGLVLYNQYRFKTKKAGKRGSKISKQLFDAILSNIVDVNETYYWSQPSGEWRISINNDDRQLLNNNQQNLFVDFKYQQSIIEFFGDFWHANPALYADNDICNPFSQLTAKEIRESDANRLQILQQKGFNVLVIWEQEFRVNPDATITKCLNFLGIKHVNRR